MENIEKVKIGVIELGGFEDTKKLDIQIKMIIDEVLAYCYRENIPDNMVYPLVDVIIGEINKKSMVIEGDVTSYKEGDMSISFGSNVSASGVKYNGKLEGFKLIRGLMNV